jgi:AAA domain, putative AbiEii toxin, Type IV TA system
VTAVRERAVALQQRSAGEGRGSMLRNLRLRDVGPAPRFDIDFSDRLNIFTGDNGLGKSFILDIAWWALTGDWAGSPAWPRRGDGVKPQIEFHLIDKNRPSEEPSRGYFDIRLQEWRLKKEPPILSGLVVYARIDGGFSLWDPARNYRRFPAATRTSSVLRPVSRGQPYFPPAPFLGPWAYHFSSTTLWNGLDDGDKILCNGLIRDWVAWQNQPATSPFESLRSVVNRLAPSPEEPIAIGSPVRIHPDEVRDIPTLKLDYGEVPLVFASAGMKRIISLAYLLTWAWDEHKQASHLRNQKPVKQIVLVIDEVESHLHPRWQRTLLPSILELGKALKAEVDLQIVATTHAPLVLASVEPQFDEVRDSLFLFEIEEKTRHVTLRKLPWAMQGDAVGWLTSPVFGLDQARSSEAEKAIEAAEAFMRGDAKRLPPGLRTKASIQKALEKTLPGVDPFWPRWIVEVKP